MSVTRRQFIGGASLVATAGAGFWLLRERTAPLPEGLLLSGFEDLPGQQYVGGLLLPESRVFGARVPARVHGHAVDPLRAARVLFFARRPGTQAFELDLATLGVREAFATPAGRHLAGHGLFSPDGAVLLTTEHDYETPRGVLGIRDAQDFRLLGEIETQGLDPHEIAWLPDGKTLVVANGGILTHPRTFRRKLNIPTMDPSLVLIEAASGRLIEQLRLPDHRLSIRHLAVTAEGNVAVGLQYEGEAAAPSVAALYRPDQELKLLLSPDDTRSRLQGYVASIAASDSSGMIAAACPYGRGIARWQLRTGEFVDFVAAAEVYGVSSAGDGTLLASQRDGTVVELGRHAAPRALQLQLPMKLRWDDHWSLRARLPGFAPPAAST